MMLRIVSLFIILNINLLAGNYVVVVNKGLSINKMSAKQIKDIFMMKRHFIEDIKVIPINLPASSSIRNLFEKKFLKTDRDRMNRYWVKQHFQGLTPPIIQSSERSMKLFLKNVKGSVGYLPKNEVDSELKVLYEF